MIIPFGPQPDPPNPTLAARAARYGLVCAAVGFVTLLLTRLAPLQPHVYALFLFVVVSTAILAGVGPALLATALSLTGMNYIEYAAIGAFRLDLDDVVQLTVFVAMSLTISFLAAQRRRAEAEVARANAELRQIDKAKDQFIATVTHELKTPVTVILGWTAVMRQDDAPEVRAEAIAAIEQSARVQSRLVEDLLDMSRILFGKLHVGSEPVSLVPVIEQAVDMIRPLARSHRIELNLTLPHDPCVVAGDPVRLQQICGNLLSNAVKFTPGGGRVDVSLSRNGSFACVEIADTGEGIRADVLPAIFEPLRQGRGATAKGGLGLGLTIVREVVTMHRGTIEAKSDGPGKGARFTVRLPLAG